MTTGNAQSRATFFRHSAALSLPAVLLSKGVCHNYLDGEGGGGEFRKLEGGHRRK